MGKSHSLVAFYWFFTTMDVPFSVIPSLSRGYLLSSFNQVGWEEGSKAKLSPGSKTHFKLIVCIQTGLGRSKESTFWWISHIIFCSETWIHSLYIEGLCVSFSVCFRVTNPTVWRRSNIKAISKVHLLTGLKKFSTFWDMISAFVLGSVGTM